MPIALWNPLQPENPSIREYLKNAVLRRIAIAAGTPRIPGIYQLSNNIKLLGVRPERYRQLRKIIQLDSRVTEQGLLACEFSA